MNKQPQSNQNDLQTQQIRLGFTQGFWSWFFFRKWYFLKSVRSIAIFFGFLSIFFAFLCILTGIIYFPLNEYQINYADHRGCIREQSNNENIKNSINSTNNINKRCQVTFKIQKQIKPPVHFLYKIQNAYINHRQYLNSFSKKQLQGNVIDQSTAFSNCQPFVYNKDMGKNVSWSGKLLDPNAIASPCGFKAFLFFNDTFKFKKINPNNVIQDIKIKQENLAQKQGKGLKYRSRDPDSQWVNPSDSHFIFWMQSQSLMTKQKLWGKIQQPLKTGQYSLIVENNYHINNMRITKGILISQSSYIGGKSYVIPLFFGLFAIGTFIYAFIFHRRFKHYKTVDQDEDQDKNN